jgi:hypothetical protein
MQLLLGSVGLRMQILTALEGFDLDFGPILTCWLNAGIRGGEDVTMDWQVTRYHEK